MLSARDRIALEKSCQGQIHAMGVVQLLVAAPPDESHWQESGFAGAAVLWSHEGISNVSLFECDANSHRICVGQIELYREVQYLELR